MARRDALLVGGIRFERLRATAKAVDLLDRKAATVERGLVGNGYKYSIPDVARLHCSNDGDIEDRHPQGAASLAARRWSRRSFLALGAATGAAIAAGCADGIEKPAGTGTGRTGSRACCVRVLHGLADPVGR